jgi:hypothetical protein
LDICDIALAPNCNGIKRHIRIFRQKNFMNDLRGRPLAACVMMLAVWTFARVGFEDYSSHASPTKRITNTANLRDKVVRYQPPGLEIIPPTGITSFANPITKSISSRMEFALPEQSAPHTLQRRIVQYVLAPTISTPAKPALLQTVQPEHVDVVSAAQSLQASPIDPAQMPVRRNSKRLSIYAYSFWRPGDHKFATGPALPQYGGSQSAIIATYRLTDKSGPDVAVRLRAAVSPGKTSEKEVAAGLVWKPVAALPVTIIAERRMRTLSPDQFAAYAAASAQNIPLALGLQARGFGQLGVIQGREPDIFFDAGARAERNLIRFDRNAVAIGVGAWAGGQRGARRFDIGPTLGTQLDLGAARLDISADWRFRIGGNASPRNGPAMTISTGF